MTRLRLVLGLALVGLWALAAACTGSADDTGASLAPSGVPARTAPSDSAAVPPCQAADPLQTVYAAPNLGYCFSFPGQFRIAEVTTQTVSLQHAQVTETTPVLAVRVEPAGADRSLEQIVNDRLVRAKQQQPNLMVKRQATRLDGLAAEEIVGLPGRPDAHWLFVLRDGDLVTLLFRPTRGATDAIQAAEQALWQQVTASFRFY